MPGSDLDMHALAANIRALEKSLNDMREENREWRNKQLEIYKALASNQTAMANLSRRVSDNERQVSELNAWRWKSVGVLTVAILVIQWLLGQ